MVFGLLVAAGGVRADGVASALYVRGDSDRTTVISPRVHAQADLAEGTRADASYAADIWTSASIDIRTSASVRPVTEQRDELNLALSQDFQDLRLHGGYRFSAEHDYTSHGGSAGAGFDLADNAATLEADLHLIADTVGQSANPAFARRLITLDGAFTYTQVLDPNMLAQFTYELAHNRGYQSSPYRVVGVGGTGLGCLAASLCLPERVPDARTRHALAVLLRRALSDELSVGVRYRFYLDDWSLSSHTVLIELGWNLAERTLLALRYRFYTQTAVGFYRPVYTSLAPDQPRTRDRELSALSYQRAGAELEQTLALGDGGSVLALSLAVSGNAYRYANFVGLDSVAALELSAGVLLRR